MSFLTEFYLSKPYNPAILVLLYWLFWPGIFFVVAPIFESHPVYLGKGQSRQFFPGDFALGSAIIMLIGLYAKNPAGYAELYISRYPFASALIQAIIVLFARIPDCARYPLRSRSSPTKITHDFCGYFVCGWLLIWYGIPELIWCIQTASFGLTPVEWIVIGASAVLYISMMVVDASHKFTREDLLKMHPDDWRFCWKK